MRKRTDGPWEIVPPRETAGWGLCVRSDREIVARIPGRGKKDDIAHLIAAAPDLLAACEAMLAQLDYLRDLWGDEGVTRSLCDRMRAAVARAKEGGVA